MRVLAGLAVSHPDRMSPARHCLLVPGRFLALYEGVDLMPTLIAGLIIATLLMAEMGWKVATLERESGHSLLSGGILTACAVQQA